MGKFSVQIPGGFGEWLWHKLIAALTLQICLYWAAVLIATLIALKHLMPVSSMWPIMPLIKDNNQFPVWLIYVSVNSKPDHPPPGDPGNSHILVASVVGFSLLCLALGSARGGVLNQNKNSIILKRARFLLCHSNKKLYRALVGRPMGLQ